MIGALVFLGCPLRMLLRLGGGDPNAIVGLVGFIVGILVGVFFLKKGFTLRRAYDQSKLEGSAFPAALLIAFLLCVTGICVGKSNEPSGFCFTFLSSVTRKSKRIIHSEYSFFGAK